jgi:large subunit ribosomal protein L13
MKTHITKKENIVRKWYLVNAEGKVLGRLAAKIASILRGKNKPDFSPHMDMGDEVVVINASKIKYSGNKGSQKYYKNYSGYPGGLNTQSLDRMLKRKPEFVIRHAVKGMLPKNKLQSKLMRKLKVYSGAEHKQTAQKPEVLEV